MLGRRKAIEYARLILEYHLEHLKVTMVTNELFICINSLSLFTHVQEVDTILQSQSEIARKLKDTGLDDQQTFYPSRGGGGRGGRGRGGWRGSRGGRGRYRNTHSGLVKEREWK